MAQKKIRKLPYENAGKNKKCHCRKRHEHHICELRAKGQTHAINLLIQNPNFACSLCGETADSDDDVCVPVPLFI
jgi:hypothetical protein